MGQDSTGLLLGRIVLYGDTNVDKFSIIQYWLNGNNNICQNKSFQKFDQVVYKCCKLKKNSDKAALIEIESKQLDESICVDRSDELQLNELQGLYAHMFDTRIKKRLLIGNTKKVECLASFINPHQKQAKYYLKNECYYLTDNVVAAIFVVRTDYPSSLMKCKQLISIYELNIHKIYNENIKGTYIIANHVSNDENSRTVLQKTELFSLDKKFLFFKVNSMTGEGIEKCFDQIVDQLFEFKYLIEISSLGERDEEYEDELSVSSSASSSSK